MNKTELVEKVSSKAGLTKKDTACAIDTVVDVITTAIKTGDKVSLVGFGTFQAVQRKARTGLNPQTGKTIQIPARKVPKFKPGKGLKEAVN